MNIQQYIPKSTMTSICQSCEINKALKTSDCTPLDCVWQCTVCMECIPLKNQSTRTCGHMMCAACDVTWRSRSFIVEKKCHKWNEEGKEEIFSVYMIDSECPSCRGKEPAGAYMERSKVSLVHEIQCLLATLHANKIKKLVGYNVVDIDHMDSAVPPVPVPRTPVRPSVTVQRRMGVVTEPVQLLQIGGREWTFIEPPPRAPIHRRIVTGEDNYIPPPVPAAVAPLHVQPTVTVLPITTDEPDPVRQQPVRDRTPPQFIDGVRVRAGTCIRKYRNLGCTTVRTTMRCVMCNAVLCRECRHQCPCRGT